MPKIINKISSNQQYVTNKLVNEIIDHGIVLLKTVDELVFCKTKHTESIVVFETKKYDKINILIKEDIYSITEVKKIFAGFIWITKSEMDFSQIAKTFLLPQYRGKGYGKLMYQEIISNKMIYSDDRQTQEAEKLWKSLFKSKSILVEAYDIKYNAFLKLGLKNDEFYLKNKTSTNSENILYRARKLK